MSKDIFKYILENDWKKRKIEIKNSENKEIISRNINIPSNENEHIKYKTNQDNIYNLSFNKDENSESNSKIFDSLNYIHIIKSFFCSKDKKTKLIDACHNYISKEICIENNLKKLNLLCMY